MSNQFFNTTVRLPENIHKLIKIRAATQHRSMSAEINYILTRALEQTETYDIEALRILRTNDTNWGSPVPPDPTKLG